MAQTLLFVSVMVVLLCIGVVVATVVASRGDGPRPNRRPPIHDPRLGRPGRPDPREDDTL